MSDGKILAFDVETNDGARRYGAPDDDIGNWPRVVQLGWVLAYPGGRVVDRRCELIVPAGWTIEPGAGHVHGITDDDCALDGKYLADELALFSAAASQASVIVAHNIGFDWPVILCEFLRSGIAAPDYVRRACTMLIGTPVCQLPGRRRGEFKWPRLDELHNHLFGRGFDGAHDAAADAEACLACYLELVRRARA